MAVYYSDCRLLAVGQTAHINGNVAKIRFLKGKFLSKTDVQDVEREYIVCRVHIEHLPDSDEFVIQQEEKDKLAVEKKAYLKFHGKR